jgi:hypothetical protein
MAQEHERIPEEMIARSRAIIESDLSQEPLVDNEMAFVQWMTSALAGAQTLVGIERPDDSLKAEITRVLDEVSDHRLAARTDPVQFSVEVRGEYDVKIRDLLQRVLHRKTTHDETEGAAA